MQTRRRYALGLALVLGLAVSLLSGVASACRVYIEPAVRIAAAFDVILVARVTSAGYLGPGHADFHPWKAAATLQRVVLGKPTTTAFEFGGSQSTAACDLRRPPQQAGELWVLYQRVVDGELRVVEAYPLSFVQGIDPRFSSPSRSPD